MKFIIGILFIVLVFVGLFYFYSMFVAAQSVNNLLLSQPDQEALFFEQKSGVFSSQKSVAPLSSLNRIKNL